MVDTTYKSTPDMVDKLPTLKSKTKLKFYQKISNFYDKMKNRRQRGNFKFEKDNFSKNVEDISKVYHEVLLLKNVLQT